MDSFNLFGDSILKGVQFDSGSRRCIVNDHLGLNAVAERAGLSMRNFSKFGCTITKAWGYVQRMFTKLDADIVLMNFGSSDCDFNWEAISRSPLDVHNPNTSLDEFVDTYNKMVDYVLSHRSTPVLTTLVPVNEKKYIEHICNDRGLDAKNIRAWLNGNDGSIAEHQSRYSQAVAEVASSRGIPLIDLRSAFNGHRNPESLLGPDGVHPNPRGQKVIHGCFEAFVGDCLAV